MKVDVIKKRLIKEAAITGSIILVLIGMYVAINNYELEQVESLNRLRAEISQINTSSLELEAELQKAKNSLKIYQESLSRSGKGAKLDIKQAGKIISDLKEAHSIIDLNITFNPVAVSERAEFTRNSVATEYIMGKINFTALTDVDAMAFLESLNSNLPGLVFIKDFMIRKSVNIDSAFIEKIYTGDKPAAVDAEIQFLWVLVKEQEVSQ